MDDVKAVERALSAPFDVGEVKWKPATVKGNRALALCFVDARVVQDRLDAVLGVAGWQDKYVVLPGGEVVCELRCWIGGQWIAKTDVGGQSEQPDEGDRMKAAFSDALKRVAVKFGVGRYLYRAPQQWCDYDPVKKQFVRPPTLPGPSKPKAAPTPAPAAAAPKPATAPTAPAAASKLPAGGADLKRRLVEYDGRLAAQGICKPGDLVKHVVQAGVKAGHPADLAAWSGPAIQLAVLETKQFEERLRSPVAASPKAVA